MKVEERKHRRQAYIQVGIVASYCCTNLYHQVIWEQLLWYLHQVFPKCRKVIGYRRALVELMVAFAAGYVSRYCCSEEPTREQPDNC